MATSIIDGPLHVSGVTQPVPTSVGGTAFPVPDPNSDAAPSLFYQGVCLPDPRLIYMKDQVQGRLGAVQAFMSSPRLKSIGQIPAATAANNIVVAQNTTINTALTITTASLGVTRQVPIHPFSVALNDATVTTAAVALDFGFAYGNCTSGSTTIVVADSTQFAVGMPLVIGGVGNSGGTIPLLTVVASITDATHIVVNATAYPLASNSTAPIGTGDFWGGQNPSGQTNLPTAAVPFLAAGPDLLLDTRQSIARGLRITGVSGGAGGTFAVVGWDLYGQPMTETVTVASGASVGYTKKAFKYLASITPSFSDAHNYTVGTSDIFGFAFFSNVWEDTQVFWAGAPMTAATGWLTGDTTTPSGTTGDVRGVIQTSTVGGGSGIGSSASNGTLSSLALTGRRLEMSAWINVAAMLRATPTTPQTLLGATQA